MSEIQKYRLLRASTHEGVSISLIEHADGDIYKVNEVDKYVTTLKSELSAARETIGDFNVQEVEHMKQIEKLQAENERLRDESLRYAACLGTIRQMIPGLALENISPENVERYSQEVYAQFEAKNERLKARVEELEDRIRVSMPYSCDRR